MGPELGMQRSLKGVEGGRVFLIENNELARGKAMLERVAGGNRLAGDALSPDFSN